jgi:hypothetical protein
MGTGEYVLQERYTIPCPACETGCSLCRGGDIAIYVLVTGHSTIRCMILGHNTVGSPERVTRLDQLPRIRWCLRCHMRWVQTDVPEAYQMVDLGVV